MNQKLQQKISFELKHTQVRTF